MILTEVAKEIATNETIVLKRIFSKNENDALREAHLMANLAHPNVCRYRTHFYDTE